MKITSKYSLSIIIFFTTIVVYILTANKDLAFTDSGELAGACVSLGVAHPTGYPLFTILGHLWSMLPLGISKIYSMNIFACFATSLSSVVFFNLLLIIFGIINLKKNNSNLKSKNKKTSLKISILTEKQIMIISFFTALIYAFAQTVWAQASSIEVYSLQALMFNLVLFVLFSSFLYIENQSKLYFVTALTLGLSFSNHMTTILLVPAVIFLYFKNPGKEFDFSGGTFKNLLFLAIPFIIGLSLYLYLPVRSSSHPEFNWGWVYRSFEKFMYHISGKQYQVWMFTGGEVVSKNFDRFISLIIPQVSWFGLIPLLFGLYKLFVSSKTIFISVILLFLSCLAYSLNYGIHDIDSYFLLAFLALFIITGFGLAGLAEFNPKIIPVFVIIPLFLLFSNYNENDNSKDMLVPEYTRIMTENLEPNAIIISAQWDYWCSAFWYKQRIEGYRKDVVLVEKELLRRTWYFQQFKHWYPETAKQVDNESKLFLAELELFESGGQYNPMYIQKYFEDLINAIIDKNYGKRPIYVTIDILENREDSKIAAEYEKIPQGYAFRLEKEKKPYPVSIDKIDASKFIKSIKNREDHLVNGIVEISSTNLLNIARYALYTNQIETGKKALELALRVDPNNSNAGALLQQLRGKR